MILICLAFIAGALTILSPCILPVLPFVFSAPKKWPVLLGMALTFVAISSLSLLAGGLAASIGEWGRGIALFFLTFVGLSLLFPHLTDKILAPLVKWGGQLSQRQAGDSIWSTFMIGVSTGFIWAPCAGPILGLILTGAATQTHKNQSIILLISYALGAICVLSLALNASRKVFTLMKRGLGADRWVKRTLGVLVLAGVAMIVFHVDRTILTQISKIETTSLESKLLERFASGASNEMEPAVTSLPEFPTPLPWINSPALRASDLKGKVVLIDFWTYSCINCLRTLPYLKAWNEKYKSAGLVIIGVHTPEFPFEKSEANVRQAVRDLGITYPVVVDADYQIWHAFQNQFWPAHYFVDAKGKIRHQHFGEGDYAESENTLRDLLTENGAALGNPIGGGNLGSGVEAQAPPDPAISPETYLGSARAEHRVESKTLKKDEWAIDGEWTLSSENILLRSKRGSIRFHFRAHDVHLVLGNSGKDLRFKIRLDGLPPLQNHGVDVDEQGNGVVSGHRLYQLLRFKDSPDAQEHTIEIQFMESGAEAYAFTFG